MTLTVDDLRRFHLLNEPVQLDPLSVSDLVPALIAPYLDLTRLRHDFPIVLVPDAPYVRSLTEITNEVLRRTAPPGPAGGRMRHHVLRLERAARRRLSVSGETPLAELWSRATDDVLAATSDDAPRSAGLAADLDASRRALIVDGPAVGCDGRETHRIVQHCWRALQNGARRRVGERIDELILGLTGILRAAEAHSAEGLSASHLAASVGGDHRDAFDFDAWSELLRSRAPGGTISDTRIDRIRSLIDVLRTQRFFPLTSEHTADAAAPYAFEYGSCVAAAVAYRDRRPAMVALVRAIAIAELELDNQYREDEHDRYFHGFDEDDLAPEDLAQFPSYLVTLSDGELADEELARLIDVIGSRAPIKVLVESSDVLTRIATADGGPISAIGRLPLPTMAVGLGTAYVVQTASSHLVEMRDRIRDGLASTGPALFHVFTGSGEHGTLPPYLSAAAAVQCRALPAFSFDPAAGPDRTKRLRLDANPAADADWPCREVAFHDAELQRHGEPTCFTPIDYAATDRRFSDHFTVAPPETWSEDMVPAALHLSPATAPADGIVPYILMASEDGTLHRVVVDRRLLRAARAVGATWRSLQELAGIHDPHTDAAIEIERAKWEEELSHSTADVEPSTPPPADVLADVTLAAAATPVAEATDTHPSDEPYIETARCTTCDECTTLNPRMFAYDDNKQAYIADLTAGTYRDMVEAAEACQVAIIHPGAPWDRSEPGLDDLTVRAAAFN